MNRLDHDVEDAVSIKRFEKDGGDALEVELVEFEDGEKLFSVTTFTEDVCDDNSIYFIKKQTQ